MGLDRKSVGADFSRSSAAPPLLVIPKQVATQHRTTSARGRMVFVTDSMIRSGSTDAFRVRLTIPEDPPSPPNQSNTTYEWKFAAAFEVAKGRDVTRSRTLQVTQY